MSSNLKLRFSARARRELRDPAIHVNFYRFGGSTLTVLRVVHGRMNVTGNLDE